MVSNDPNDNAVYLEFKKEQDRDNGEGLIRGAREELNATIRALKYAKSFEERETINAHIDCINEWLNKQEVTN